MIEQVQDDLPLRLRHLPIVRSRVPDQVTAEILRDVQEAFWLARTTEIRRAA
jgi:hypothetical protein